MDFFDLNGFCDSCLLMSTNSATYRDSFWTTYSKNMICDGMVKLNEMSATLSVVSVTHLIAQHPLKIDPL